MIYLENIAGFFEQLYVKFDFEYRTSIFYNGDPTFQEESVALMVKILQYVTDPKVLNNIHT
jgi:hypothetical protein